MFEIKTNPNESMQNYPPEAKLEPDRKAGRHAGLTGEHHMAEVGVPGTPSGYWWRARHEPFAPAPKSYYFVSQNDEPMQSRPGELGTVPPPHTFITRVFVSQP